MALPHSYSEPVQLLAFVLQKGSSWDLNLLTLLEKTWGRLIHKGALFPFDRTDYYESEMGENLYRGVLSFEYFISPEKIKIEKETSNQLELDYSMSQKRSVNIDVGYMDLDKVVLPSFKRGPFKLYAGDGIWLDMLLTYAKGHFKPTAWAFDDFLRNPYEHDLLLVREKFKKHMSLAKK